MPRPKTVSDADVLTSALALLAEAGMGFTLSDLASRVGLSRATLIQRFGDRDAILRRIAAHEVQATRDWLDSLPVETDPGALWRFLALIVGSMGSGESFAPRVALAAMEARDPVLRDLAGQRYALVQDAIAARLPQHPHADAMARHLHLVIAGSTMRWVASSAETGLADQVLHDLRWALETLGLPVDTGSR
jgi:TetR/AcrR family macrolide resistance operon transcriptional repressor